MTGLFAVLLLISLTVGAKLPDSIPEVLKAKRIEVLAPDGKTGIILGANSGGSAIVLTAPGKDHKRVIALSADKEGVRLVLMKHAEAPLFIANVDDNGSSLSLFDAREPSRNPAGVILSSIYSDEVNLGGTSISLIKGSGKSDVQAGLSIQDNNKAASLFLGGDNEKSVNIRVNQENGKIGFFDENDKAIWTMP
jgi:hypothetical protein